VGGLLGKSRDKESCQLALDGGGIGKGPSGGRCKKKEKEEKGPTKHVLSPMIRDPFARGGGQTKIHEDGKSVGNRGKAWRKRKGSTGNTLASDKKARTKRQTCTWQWDPATRKEENGKADLRKRRKSVRWGGASGDLRNRATGSRPKASAWLGSSRSSGPEKSGCNRS